MKTRTLLGRELAKLRIDFGETMAQMAKRLGYSQTHLFNIEMGDTKPKLVLIERIKTQYGKDLEDQFFESGGVSSVKIELDKLTSEERQVAVNLWRKSLTGKAPASSSIKIEAVGTVTTAANTKQLKELVEETSGLIEKRRVKLSDEELAEIEDLS